MRSTTGFGMATLLALVILVPIGASARRGQSRPFVELVEQAEGMANVRTTSRSVGPNRIIQTAGVEVVRTLIPSAEPPTFVSASRVIDSGEEILACRLRGKWFEVRSIVVGKVALDPLTVSVPRLTAAIASLQSFFKQTDEEPRAQHLVQMLRSKDPLLQGAALDLLGDSRVAPNDEIYGRVIAMATCDGRFVLPAIAQMVRFPFERKFETLQKLVTCEQDMVARVAFQAIQGINTACPLAFEAVRSPTTRDEAYRAFLECRDRRAEKYSGQPPRRDVQ